MRSVVAILLLGIVGLSWGAVSYEGYRLVRVRPITNSIVENVKFFSTLNDVSLWTPLRGVGVPVDVMLGPDVYFAFLQQMEYLDAPTYLIIRDVQEKFDELNKLNKMAKERSEGSPRMEHTYYRTLDEINSELDALEASYPSLISTSSIGTTYEGRDMRLTKVSAGDGSSLPVIWIDCGIHAREWVSPSSCLYFLDQLKEYGNAGSDVTDLLDTYDFLVLTVTNPDGYDFTWTGDRLWRKNRFPFGLCYGVDLNRNFDSDFGGPGTSDQPCSDIYHGPSAFSEPETQAMRDTLISYGSRVKAVFTLHAYSQLWMTPYGYTTALPADYDEMYRVAGIGVGALEGVYGTNYQYGNIADIIYEAAGGSVDYTYDTLGVTYSFALELRDKGLHGFTLPPEQIEPTAVETWEGLKAAIRAFN